jgi:hypothetical protein
MTLSVTLALGLPGREIPLAEYRVHGQSMLRATTHHQENNPQLIKEMKQGPPVAQHS